MTPRRLAELRVAHALADGDPIGPVLRSLPLGSAARAGAAAEAGRLEDGLRLAGIPADLAWLAPRWPAAVLPALRRIATIPPAFVFQASLLQVLGYFALVALFQVVALLVLGRANWPTELAIEFPVFAFVRPALGAFMALTGPVAVWATVGFGSRLPPWQRHRVRAREAALGAALGESGAPEAVRSAFARTCRVLKDASGDELDAVLAHALSASAASHQRFVAALRFVGYAILTALGATTLLAVYRVVADVHGGVFR